MSPAKLPRLLTAGMIALLAACEDDSPTGPMEADFPDMGRATPAEAVTAAVVAANGRIAFRSDRVHFSNWEIYVMNPDGSGQTRVTNYASADREPTWSPDGTKLAFTREVNGIQPDIFLMTPGATDTAIVNLTNTGTLWDWEAAWNPDGSKLAFTRMNGSNWGVYVMSSSNGSGQTRITSSTGYEFTPSWSPDGTKLAVTCRPGGTTSSSKDICVMNADGSGLVNLITETGWEEYDPAWSPDGSKIAFTRAPTGSNIDHDIYVMNADGTNKRQLTGGSSVAAAWDIDPTWSPDGTKIAFSSNRTGNYEIFVMNSDGSGQTNLTNSPGNDGQPSWQALGSTPPPVNQAPNGTITSPASNVTVQVGQTVSFAGSGTDADGTIAGYAWSFAGGSPASSSVQNPGAVTFATAGTYTVTLTVTDNGGAADPTPATRTVTVQGTTPPAGVSVTVTGTAFTPAIATGTQGGTVRWAFQGPGTHNVADKSGMALFASGSKAVGTSYSFLFQGAGTYAYHCSLHPTTHSGQIRVPVQVSPARGTATTTFTVTWASATAPSGYVYDIQIKRPGTTSFVNWKVGQTVRSATFTPDRGAGTYVFRARLKKLSNGKVSGWSPTKAVGVS